MGPLRKDATNPRYFTDGNGKSIYLTGSHVWFNLEDSGPSLPIAAYDYNSFLTVLSSRHHNFFRLWANENARWAPTTNNYWGPLPFARSSVCCAADGGNKFDLNTFNQAYFDRLRTRVIQAQQLGIYVGIMLFNGWNIESKGFSGNPWTSHHFRGGNNVQNVNGDTNGDNQGREIHSYVGTDVNSFQKAYVRKVIDTVNDLDNVLYEISNESGVYSTSWQYDMINYIKSYESGKAMQHPVGMTFQWPDGNNNNLFSSPADWISPNPSAASPYDYMYNPPPADGSKVVISDTDHLWGVGGGHEWVWMSFTRGLNPTYMDDDLAAFPANQSHENVRQNMGASLDYARKMNLRGMTPHGELTSTGFALANPGSEYLVYQKGSGAFTVNLAAATYQVEWYNPSTNILTSGGSITASAGSRSFTAPFSNDAVLYLKSSTSTPPPPNPIQPPAGCPAPAANAFTACYFKGITLSQFVLSRTDAAPLNFAWGYGSPDPSIPTDGFSARWEGSFTFNAGTYTFSVTSDDGVRLYVDDRLVIDRWIPQAPTTYTATVAMSAGSHKVRMEYYEDGGAATAKLSWTLSGGTNPAPLTRYLSDLTWIRATNGWGPAEKDKSNGELAQGDGHAITIHGSQYAKGLGVHAASDVTYNLGGQCSTFQADIGLDDEIAPLGSIVFQVLKDGTKVFDSGLITNASGKRTISVDITGATNLDLVVTTGGDNNYNDHADWAGARVVCTSSAILK